MSPLLPHPGAGSPRNGLLQQHLTQGSESPMKNDRRPALALFALLAAALSAAPLVAQVNLTVPGTAYTQNFNALSNSGTANAWSDNTTIQGWYAAQGAAGTTAV